MGSSKKGSRGRKVASVAPPSSKDSNGLMKAYRRQRVSQIGAELVVLCKDDATDKATCAVEIAAGGEAVNAEENAAGGDVVRNAVGGDNINIVGADAGGNLNAAEYAAGANPNAAENAAGAV
ncbi:hypothetical protein ACP70R_040500 [Stipagrostis hirtigluma subsp. patula]